MNTAALAQRLRTATRSAHRALDHHPLLRPLTATTLTLTEYARALAALHAPQAALEASVAGFAPARQFSGRLAALDADLAELGHSPWPLRALPPPAHSPAAQVGLLYVLEGARLGAATLARCLARSLPDAPRRFFPDTADPARWQAFWSFADRHCPPHEAAEAVGAALAGFACYRQHLNACIQAG